MVAAKVTALAAAEWPRLDYSEWKDTQRALHMWTQILGKIRLKRTPLLNHYWHSTLFVSPRGLTTGLTPNGMDAFQIDLDLVGHELTIVTGRGSAAFPLGPMAVADFYRRVIAELARLGVPDPKISVMPREVADAIPFTDDVAIRPYDRAQVERYRTILLRAQFVFDRFRAEFLGKASPVHFFWGAFDLGSARFSGRRAPSYAGGTPPNLHIHVMHEAYAHELIEAGLWVGNDETPRAEFYSFAIPAPPGIADAQIRPNTAAWVPARGEFLLSYDDMRRAEDPSAALLEFLRSTYDAAADLAEWDRPTLEKKPRCFCDPLPAFAREGAGRT